MALQVKGSKPSGRVAFFLFVLSFGAYGLAWVALAKGYQVNLLGHHWRF